jgi:hypothetical protein
VCVKLASARQSISNVSLAADSRMLISANAGNSPGRGSGGGGGATAGAAEVNGQLARIGWPFTLEWRFPQTPLGLTAQSERPRVRTLAGHFGQAGTTTPPPSERPTFAGRVAVHSLAAPSGCYAGGCGRKCPAKCSASWPRTPTRARAGSGVGEELRDEETGGSSIRALSARAVKGPRRARAHDFRADAR